MRLHSIAENFISQKMRDAIITSKAYNERPITVTNNPYEASTGMDGSNVSQNGEMSEMPSGIPMKPRHRTFLGLGSRPGTIRL